MRNMFKNAFGLRFTAEGLSLEKLLRMAGEKQIALHALKREGAKKVVGRVAESDYPRLLELADARGWALTKGRTLGLAALRDKVKRHWGLAAGFFALLIVMIVALQFIWAVDILDAGAYEGDVRAFLEQMEIRPGILKSKVDLRALESLFEWRYPDTAWIKTRFSGANLVIRVIQGVPVPNVAPYGSPNDVTAKCDGIITSIEPYAGTPLVKLGQLVKKGQVLIKGEERLGAMGDPQAVKARGRVMARVWLGARVSVSAISTLSTPTGQVEEAQWIQTPYITLFKDQENPFEHADTHMEIYPLVGAFFPVSLVRAAYIEVALEHAPRDEAQVKNEAGQAAMRRLIEKLADDDELVDKWVDYCMIEGKDMEATAFAEVIRDIAVAGNPP